MLCKLLCFQKEPSSANMLTLKFIVLKQESVAVFVKAKQNRSQVKECESHIWMCCKFAWVVCLSSAQYPMTHLLLNLKTPFILYPPGSIGICHDCIKPIKGSSDEKHIDTERERGKEREREDRVCEGDQRVKSEARVHYSHTLLWRHSEGNEGLKGYSRGEN